MRICLIDGCENKHYGHGYCQKHYTRARNNGLTPSKGDCSADGCDLPAVTKGYCRRHYGQILVFGKTKRTKFDKNAVKTDGRKCVIELYDAFGKIKAKTMIDAIDYDRVKRHKWCLMNTGYAGSVIDGKLVLLHRFLVGPSANSSEVDHINRNRLDNRLSNLRVVTRDENQWNTTLRANNSSGYKGVYRANGRWIARIMTNKKAAHLGCFDDINDAALAYNEAAMERGEHTFTNAVRGV